jgi:NAD(P)-dependent dehydrogenase (short-subunit alcohol dehydrogenase family)
MSRSSPGGTFGVGRGIASELGQCGARVFVTGRSVDDGSINDHIIGIRCDHRMDAEVATRSNALPGRLTESTSS